MEDPRIGHETILLVEDDMVVRISLADSLQHLGYTVVVAKDGPAALAALESQPVDLVVTDIVMPGGISGLELAERVAATRPGLGFIFMSGHADALGGATVKLTKDDLLLSKPFSQGDIAQAIRRVIDKHVSSQSAPSAPPP
jgi:CheY-like chemotaxis protein|tara:strand:+ start:95 stop:517 length:423 start_codon:yes stop_codon:yes gene_type:complete